LGTERIDYLECISANRSGRTQDSNLLYQLLVNDLIERIRDYT
jgi:hypothetical protein